MSLTFAVSAEHNEAELVSLAQDGDRSAFAVLIERHYDALHRWLMQVTRDPHLAEDLVQETFLKAFAGLSRFQSGTNLRAWLFRIAQNNRINQLRKAAKQKDALPDDVPATDEPEPIQRLEQEESLKQLTEEIDKLPEMFRAPFLLRIQEGYSFREIAGIFKLSEETARWRVFKARQLLMSALSTDQESS